MPKNDKRINLRIDAKTYTAYENIANALNHSVTDFVRQTLQSGVPALEALHAIILRAEAGDEQAVRELGATFWKLTRGQLDMAELTSAAHLADLDKATQKGGTV